MNGREREYVSIHFEYQKEKDEKMEWMDEKRERLTEVLGLLCLEVLSCYHHRHHR